MRKLTSVFEYSCIPGDTIAPVSLPLLCDHLKVNILCWSRVGREGGGEFTHLYVDLFWGNYCLFRRHFLCSGMFRIYTHGKGCGRGDIMNIINLMKTITKTYLCFDQRVFPLQPVVHLELITRTTESTSI